MRSSQANSLRRTVREATMATAPEQSNRDSRNRNPTMNPDDPL